MSKQFLAQNFEPSSNFSKLVFELLASNRIDLENFYSFWMSKNIKKYTLFLCLAFERISQITLHLDNVRSVEVDGKVTLQFFNKEGYFELETIKTHLVNFYGKEKAVKLIDILLRIVTSLPKVAYAHRVHLCAYANCDYTVRVLHDLNIHKWRQELLNLGLFQHVLCLDILERKNEMFLNVISRLLSNVGLRKFGDDVVYRNDLSRFSGSFLWQKTVKKC